MQGSPNFFLVGAPKAGSTSLYSYLGQHPEIYMSPIKEPHYFSSEIRFENFTPEMQRMDQSGLASKIVSEWPEYLKLFQHANREKAIGEASVCYLWSKTAPANIAAKFPEARILMVLRNPVERAFSQYLHMLTFAESYVPFREHVEVGLRPNHTQIGKLYPFLEFGLYHEQVKRYLALFPRDHIQIYFYDDYLEDPMTVVQDIFRFLGVDRNFMPDFSERHMQARVPRSYFLNGAVKRLGLWERTKALSPPALRSRLRHVAFRPRETFVIDPADRDRLLDFYRQDIQNLSTLLNRDLSAWL